MDSQADIIMPGPSWNKMAPGGANLESLWSIYFQKVLQIPEDTFMLKERYPRQRYQTCTV